MINVSREIATAFLTGNGSKYVGFTIFHKNEQGIAEPEYYRTEDFVNDSLLLKQGIHDTDILDYSGCISSYCEVTLYRNIQRNRIGDSCYLYIGTSMENCWCVFSGKIADVSQSYRSEIGKLSTKIVAYDSLHFLENETMGWSVDDRINSIVNTIAIRYSAGNSSIPELINGNNHPNFNDRMESIRVLDVLKAIGQVNLTSPVIDRYGYLTFRQPDPDISATYITREKFPSYSTLPGLNTFPGRNTAPIYRNNYIPNYKKMIISEVSEENVTKIISYRYYADSTDEIATVYESPREQVTTGRRIILEKSVITGYTTGARRFIDTMLANFRNNKKYCYELTTVGLPYLETGDIICVDVIEFDDDGKYKTTRIPLIIGFRTLKGIQNMEDTFTFNFVPQGETTIFNGGADNILFKEVEPE